MNHHSPPGGWEPPEPSWMVELRAIDKHITEQIKHYLRCRRLDMLRWFLGGMAGYWTGFLTVKLLEWSTGIK